jgi:hypothetical protein
VVGDQKDSHGRYEYQNGSGEPPRLSSILTRKPPRPLL